MESLNFSSNGFPSRDNGHAFTEKSLSTIAEKSIIETILDGCGGIDVESEKMSEGGLRFIRYLLSISRAARFGFIPNFSDLNAIREVARQFIRYCGGAAIALYTMNEVLEGEVPA